MQTHRKCGVLLHPTSLPGSGGVGSFGDEAFRFVDLLEHFGISLWQVLPLTPPSCGNSPYSSFSAFAGNPLLIDLEQLVREGDLPTSFTYPEFPENFVEFSQVLLFRDEALHQAATVFLAAGRCQRKEEFWHFCDTTPWLHDYALFMAIKKKFKGKSWQRWPADAAHLTPEAFERFSAALGTEIGIQKYLQWQFFRQWQTVRQYALSRNIGIIGDIPIFVGYDSCDVWRNRRLFLLDEKGAPTFLAGVPPDYFSKKGQLWGNPLYDWDVLEREGFEWWIERFRWMFSQFDRVRIDHFRGFEAAWHVKAGEKTAVRGSWVRGPGNRLFDAVRAALGNVSIIAEDLGVITPAVEALRDDFNFPGMKILHFAFGASSSNPYLPHNYSRSCVAYTGTHDNNTTLGWYRDLLPHQKEHLHAYIGTDGADIAFDLIRTACMSVADTVIIPLQDILRLPGEARMNIPGTCNGNWGWRFSWDQIDHGVVSEVHRILEIYGRLAPG